MARYVCLFIFILISQYATRAQNMVSLHGSCTNSVQCAGVAICVKDICQCPPEYGAFGVSCVYLDQESHPVIPPQPAAGPSPLNTPQWAAPPPPPPVSPVGSNLEPSKLQSLLIPNVHSPSAVNPLMLPPPAPAVLYAYPGSSCGTRNLCIGGSVCQNGICTCPPGYVQSSFTCVRQVPQSHLMPQPQPSSLILPQSHVSQHLTANYGNSRESLNSLSTNSLISNSIRLPFQRTNSFYGDVENSISSILGHSSGAHPSQFIERLTPGMPSPSVSCPPDQVPMGATCVPQKTIAKYPIGILCADGIECPGVAVCINSVCTCPSGYVWTSNGCSTHTEGSTTVERRKTTLGTRPKSKKD